MKILANISILFSLFIFIFSEDVEKDPYTPNLSVNVILDKYDSTQVLASQNYIRFNSADFMNNEVMHFTIKVNQDDFQLDKVSYKYIDSNDSNNDNNLKDTFFKINFNEINEDGTVSLVKYFDITKNPNEFDGTNGDLLLIRFYINQGDVVISNFEERRRLEEEEGGGQEEEEGEEEVDEEEEREEVEGGGGGQEDGQEGGGQEGGGGEVEGGEVEGGEIEGGGGVEEGGEEEEEEGNKGKEEETKNELKDWEIVVIIGSAIFGVVIIIVIIIIFVIKSNIIKPGGRTFRFNGYKINNNNIQQIKGYKKSKNKFSRQKQQFNRENNGHYNRNNRANKSHQMYENNRYKRQNAQNNNRRIPIKSNSQYENSPSSIRKIRIDHL